MILNEHSNLKGKHSPFSPSNPSFFNYDPDSFAEKLMGKYRSSLGTDIHEFADIKIRRCHKVSNTKEMIRSIDEFIFNKYYDDKYNIISKEGTRILRCLKYVQLTQPDIFETVRSYINDAVGFKMFTEVVLYYSDDFFGTADTLIFTDKLLRIHDLKTGVSPAHIEQLLGYAALFCLEYSIDPFKIDTELRIYQNNDILVATPTGEDIQPFIDKYVAFNKSIEAFEGGYK